MFRWIAGVLYEVFNLAGSLHGLLTILMINCNICLVAHVMVSSRNFGRVKIASSGECNNAVWCLNFEVSVSKGHVVFVHQFRQRYEVGVGRGCIAQEIEIWEASGMRHFQLAVDPLDYNFVLYFSD